MENDDLIFSVTQVNTYLKNILDAEELLFNIKVFGEISGYYISRNIAYFSIKDKTAILPCVLFNAENFLPFNDGEKVVVTGSPKFYIKGGKLSFNANKIEKIGVGELYKQFLELKEKLESAGFFDKIHKKNMPSQIQKIGIITSKTGAVLQDVINVASRRNSNIELFLIDVKVQGANSEREIANAINLFNEIDVDAIIIARGGGSKEDLKSFNTMEVAEAVFNSNKFIVSAVGHEVDFSITDLVADLRAPTPSAAAELLVADKISELKLIYSKLNTVFSQYTNKLNEKLHLLNNNIHKLSNKIESLIEKSEYKTEMLREKIIELNPKTILQKGYGKIFKNKKALSSINNLKIGDKLEINLLDGKISVKIDHVEGEN